MSPLISKTGGFDPSASEKAHRMLSLHPTNRRTRLIIEYCDPDQTSDPYARVRTRVVPTQIDEPRVRWAERSSASANISVGATSSERAALEESLHAFAELAMQNVQEPMHGECRRRFRSSIETWRDAVPAAAGEDRERLFDPRFYPALHHALSAPPEDDLLKIAEIGVIAYEQDISNSSPATVQELAVLQEGCHAQIPDGAGDRCDNRLLAYELLASNPQSEQDIDVIDLAYLWLTDPDQAATLVEIHPIVSERLFDQLDGLLEPEIVAELRAGLDIQEGQLSDRPDVLEAQIHSLADVLGRIAAVRGQIRDRQPMRLQARIEASAEDRRSLSETMQGEVPCNDQTRHLLADLLAQREHAREGARARLAHAQTQEPS